MNNYRIPTQKINIFSYELSVEKKGKKEYYYQLLHDGKKQFQFTHNNGPSQLNHTSNVVKGIMKVLSGKIKVEVDGIEGNVSDEAIQKRVMDSLFHVDQLMDAYHLNRDEIERKQSEKEKEKYFKDLSNEAEKFMDFLIDNDTNLVSFLWYACIWLTGAESKNTLKGFICHISTYFKIKPVWFLALGKAGEGKSFIDDSAHVLIPDDAVLNGRMSESVLHSKTLELGIDYLDGKILLMKDMGEKRDIEKWMDTLSRYKELTTEGKIEVEKRSDAIDESTGERGSNHFIVEGKPSVSLTSKHTEIFDEQIMRRAVDVSPEATNEQARDFQYYNQGLISKKREEIIEQEIGLFHKYLESIKEFYGDVEVINPYWTCLEKWFNKSEYYKSSLTLYPSLVKAITVLHIHDREKLLVDGKQHLVATRRDNKIVADLFNPSQGISESSIRIFNLMLSWYGKYDYEELEAYKEGRLKIRDCETIFTAGEIKNRGSKIRALKGLSYGEIVSTLVNHGLIEPIDKMLRGNNNIYILSHHEKLDHTEIIFDHDMIMKHVDDLCWMYSLSPRTLRKIIIEEIEKNDQEYSIGELKLPPWLSESPLTSRLYTAQAPDHIFYIPHNTANDNDRKSPQDTEKVET